VRISIIIPCHNGIDDTRACLRALAEQSERDLEILLVDNGSRDGSHLLSEEFPAIRVLRQGRNLGFAGGVNQGLRAAQGELIVALNNDSMPAPRMLEFLRIALESDSRIAMCAPVSNRVKGPARIDVGEIGETLEGRRQVEALLDEEERENLQDRSNLAGLCLMFRARLVRKIGLFDERFGSGNFEDDDYSLRCRLLGRRLVIVRNAFLHHRGQRTFDSLGIDYAASLSLRQEKFFEKWGTSPVGRAIRAELEQDSELAGREAAAALLEQPQWIDAHLHMARAAIQAKDHAAAAESLHRFLAISSQHGEAQLLLASCRLAMGLEIEARESFIRCLENSHVDPREHAAGLYAFSHALIGRQASAEAMSHLELAAEIQPENGAIHNLLALAQLECGLRRQAIAGLQRASDLGNEQARANLQALSSS
jgi:GT2 family glycosyltransferase